MSENRISAQSHGLFDVEEPAHWDAQNTGVYVYDSVAFDPSLSVFTWVPRPGGRTLKPASRPLSDVDFGELLENLQGSIDRSAVAAQTVVAGVELLHKAIHASKEAVLREVWSERRTRILLLATLGSDRFRPLCPLPVEVSVDQDGTVAAQSPDLEQYGAGETEYEALDDLRQAIVESYSYFLEHEGELGPHPQALLGRYRQLIAVTR